MRKTSHKLKFTLVELIVAMAVFSILLLLMLQFFPERNGSGTAWRSEMKSTQMPVSSWI